MLIPALGGPERKIAEVFQSAISSCTYLTWSPDGNSLVVSDRDIPNQPTGLFLLAIDTGEKRRLTSPPSPATLDWSGDSCPSLSPDGRTLAFIRTGEVKADLYLLAVSDGLKAVDEPKRIELGNLRAYAPGWTEDGREIVFWNTGSTYLNTDNESGLWRIDVSGSSQTDPPNRSDSQLLGANAIEAAISRRGHRLAYTSFSIHSSIWRITAPGGSKTNDVKSAGSEKGDTPFIYSTRNELCS